MAEPAVTVVIPTRNRLPLLQEAVASVQAQTFQDWQLIVVDDASEDGTRAWVQTLADPRIRAIRLQNQSERSAARNRGLVDAGGEYVLFLDDDDRLTGVAIEQLVKELRRSQRAVGAAGGVLQFDARGHRRRVPWVRRRWVGEVWPQILWGWWILPGQALIRREALTGAAGWNESLYCAEDQELWLRLGLRGPAVLIPRIVLENRVHLTWRGVDTAEVEQSLRSVFVGHLESTDRFLASRVLCSQAHFGTSVNQYKQGQYALALKAWINCLGAVPRIVLSAPIRHRVLRLGFRLLVGSIVGRRGMDLLRCAAAGIRSGLGRSPQGSVAVSGSAVVGGRARDGDGSAGAANRTGSGPFPSEKT